MSSPSSALNAPAMCFSKREASSVSIGDNHIRRLTIWWMGLLVKAKATPGCSRMPKNACPAPGIRSAGISRGPIRKHFVCSPFPSSTEIVVQGVRQRSQACGSSGRDRPKTPQIGSEGRYRTPKSQFCVFDDRGSYVHW
jgi:hypothetical protein